MSKLNEILVRVLKIEDSALSDTLTPEEVDSWDSMNAMILVAELEKTYKIRFTSEEVIGVKCVGDIKEVIAKHGADPNI